MNRYILSFYNNTPILPITFEPKTATVIFRANYYEYDNELKLFTFYDEEDNIKCCFDNKENVLISFEERK